MTAQKVLLTRPSGESLKLQQELDLIGINSDISPALEIEETPFQFHHDELQNYDGILITSKYSATYLPIFSENIPIFSIGRETTKSLEDNGLKVSFTADHSSKFLYELLKKQLPQAKRFIHFGGKHISENFKKHIINSDLDIEHKSVYIAKEQSSLTKDAASSLKNNQISTVFLFSPRSAEIFEKLCEQAGLSDRLKTITALCLAPTVVKSLNNMKWKAIIHAKQPNAASMIETYTGLIKSQE